jgi:tetratricopeptide (TPR) repeat protein
VKAAAGLAAGQAAAGSVPAGIAALAQGGVKTMSLRKSLAVAVMLLLGLGVVGGGTVMLAQAPAKEQGGVKEAAAPAAEEETDLALFREGGQRFLAGDYRGAHSSFNRLVEDYPDSALVPTAKYMGLVVKIHVSEVGEGRPDEARVAQASRVIDAVLAGARAAAGRQPPARQKDQSAQGVPDQSKVNELMRQFHACYKEGKYKEAEMYARAAQELDPDNADVHAAVRIAGIQRRRAEYQGPKENTESLEKEIERCLQRPVSLVWRDAPLSQVLDDLRAWYGLNIVVDQPALEEAGISLRHPVSVHLGNVSLKSALTLLLHDVRLTYIVRDGVLVVTTPAVGRGKPVLKVYRVGQLAGRDAKGEALIRLITRTIEPASWDVMGGSGTVDYDPRGRALVVNQTPDVQEQVADLLEALSRVTDDADEKRP